MLPETVDDELHVSELEQINSLTIFIDNKLKEYSEIKELNSAAVFVVNYVQNRFVSTVFCQEIAKLFSVLDVKSYDKLKETLEKLKNDSVEMKSSIEGLEEVIGRWNTFLKDIDTSLDVLLGPCAQNNVTPHVPSSQEEKENEELGLQSKTISYYVEGSPYDNVLIVVAKTFSKPEANEHILGLYKRIDELRSMGCDVFLLTKGPPLGTRGGAYIKLIGVPFRKLYDAAEAEKELKAHRRSALALSSWDAMCTVVESSVCDWRPTSASASTGVGDNTTFLSQKGGTILVNKAGEVLFKHMEDDSSSFPSIDEIVAIVAKQKKSAPKEEKSRNLAKVNSEVSVANETTADKKKSCCIIL